jgi:signal transduction histidine kinase
MSEQNGLRLPWRRRRKPSTEIHEFVAALASRALTILESRERIAFMESEIRRVFGFRRAEVLVRPERSERFSSESTRVRGLLSRAGGYLQGWRKPFLNEAVARDIGAGAILKEMGATYVFPIGAIPGWSALLVVDSAPAPVLDSDTESLLVSLCRQIAVVLDNSALLRSKLELERTLSHQAQIVQLGEMTARIAHEIKNPLSSIKTIVQVMQEDSGLTERYGDDLALIRGEIDRLAASVMQLLNFARPVVDQQEPVEVRKVVDAVIAFLRHDLEQGGVSVENGIPDRLPPVLGSSSSIKEVFLNLMLNALQAGGPGMQIAIRGGEVVLEDEAERFVLITFEDDGPGVTPGVLEKMFTPFFTTRQRGTGLGLAIVKRNLEFLGGDISVESPVCEGRGTRFLIHLPVYISSNP